MCQVRQALLALQALSCQLRQHGQAQTQVLIQTALPKHRLDSFGADSPWS